MRGQDLLHENLCYMARRGLFRVWPAISGSFQGQDGKFSTMYPECLVAFAVVTAHRLKVLPQTLRVVGMCVIDDMLVEVEFDGWGSAEARRRQVAMFLEILVWTWGFLVRFPSSTLLPFLVWGSPYYNQIVGKRVPLSLRGY